MSIARINDFQGTPTSSRRTDRDVMDSRARDQRPGDFYAIVLARARKAVIAHVNIISTPETIIFQLVDLKELTEEIKGEMIDEEYF